MTRQQHTPLDCACTVCLMKVDDFEDATASRGAVRGQTNRCTVAKSNANSLPIRKRSNGRVATLNGNAHSGINMHNNFKFLFNCLCAPLVTSRAWYAVYRWVQQICQRCNEMSQHRGKARGLHSYLHTTYNGSWPILKRILAPYHGRIFDDPKESTTPGGSLGRQWPKR